MPQQWKKKCSRHVCRTDAASPRARFCMSCFQEHVAAVGMLRGNGEKENKKCIVHGSRNDVQGSRWGRFCPSCFKKNHLKIMLAVSHKSGLIRKQLSWEKFQKKCSMRGCRNDAASRRARFCSACFKKNAAAVGRLRGNRQKEKKKCSGHGCMNDVQGSRWARFCPSCFKKNHQKVMLVASHKSALLRKKLSRENFQKKCITRGCRNDAASRWGRFCMVCFKKNRRLIVSRSRHKSGLLRENRHSSV